MKRRMLVGLAVGVVFMALAFWGVPFGEFFAAFERMEPTYLIPIAVLFVFQDSLRALRQLILMRSIAPAVRFSSSLSIFFISFFCIHMFPARLGELVRPYLFYRKEGIPLGAGFGIVVAERAVDLLSALTMLLVVLIWVGLPGALTLGSFSLDLDVAARILGIVLAPLSLAGIVLMAFEREWALRLASRAVALVQRALPHPWICRVTNLLLRFVEAFAEGFSSFRSLRDVALIVMLTAVAWSAAIGMYALMARAFGIGAFIGYGESLAVMVITMLGSMLPAPPAMAGVQEALGRGAVALFGVKGPGLAGVGLAYAVAIHWGQVVLQSLCASFFIIKDGVGLGELFSHAREQGVGPEGDHSPR